MPAGVSWGQYLKFMTSAMVAMLAGSQIVHLYYRPLDDLEIYVQNELENKAKSIADSVKEKNS